MTLTRNKFILSLLGALGLAKAQSRIIASIHGSNISSRIEPGKPEWIRASQWDAHCAVVMKL